MVRLLPKRLTLRAIQASGFNPTMVRLLLRILTPHLGGLWGFNPTMVRLLQHTAIPTDNATVKFQSHNGAIAATP